MSFGFKRFAVYDACKRAKRESWFPFFSTLQLAGPATAAALASAILERTSLGRPLFVLRENQRKASATSMTDPA